MNRGLRREISTLSAVASLGFWVARDRPRAAVLAACALALRFWPTTTRSFRDRVVVITGGSRGLGLALAERFIGAGARVALLARDTAELERAQILLETKLQGRVLGIPCDVTDAAALTSAIGRVEREFRRIDILVNNAGAIAIGPFECMDREDFEQMLALSVHAIADATKAVLPGFRRRGRGHIVNICSFGGKVGVPHMSAYCAGKFALAGLSTTLGAELASDNIGVTTVYPAVMRVGSTIQAAFKGNAEKEYAWYASSAMLPGISISAESAARKIVEAVRHGDAEVVFPVTAKLAALAHAAFPEISAFVTRRAAGLFPPGDSHALRSGASSKRWLDRQIWYWPLRAVARRTQERWNQRASTNGGRVSG